MENLTREEWMEVHSIMTEIICHSRATSRKGIRTAIVGMITEDRQKLIESIWKKTDY